MHGRNLRVIPRMIEIEYLTYKPVEREENGQNKWETKVGGERT